MKQHPDRTHAPDDLAPHPGCHRTPPDLVRVLVRARRCRRVAATLVVLLAGVLAPRGAGAVAVTLDPVFGSGGTVALALSPGSGADEAFALALDGDGRMVVAGYASGPRQQMVVVRLDASGALDPSFGAGGVVALDIGVRARAQALVLQRDGKIVVAGFAVLVPSGIEQFVAARLLPDGTLDPGFGDGGAVATAFGTRATRASAVALQEDGAVVLGGWSRNSANRDVALVRYTSDGALDPDFGTGGRASYAFGLSNDEATAVAIQPDGRIVFAGYAADGSHHDLLVGRTTASGALDPTFAARGFRRISAGDGVEQANALLLQGDGKIVVAGQSKIGGNLRFVLARLDATGALDTSFTGGVVTTAIGELAEGKAIAALSRGRLVVAGRARLAGGNLQIVAARYQANGVLDSTFGTAGRVLVPLGVKGDEGSAVAVQDDGAIVLAGTTRTGSNADFGLARLVVDDCGDGFVDAGEACDGGVGPSCCSSTCTVVAAGESCRGAADACDVAEVCDGSTGTCPADDVLPDGDDDGVCDEQDLCPVDPDALQRDGDHDGLGDACDPCTGGVPLERATVRFGGLQTPPGDDTLKLVGSVTLTGGATLTPATHGARVLLHAADGSLLFDVAIPPGKLDPASGRGWKVTPNGRVAKFRSPTLVGGLIRKVRMIRALTPGRYHLKITGKDLDLSQLPLFGALQVTVVVDPSRAALGRCSELTFTAPERSCALSDDHSTLVCK